MQNKSSLWIKDLRRDRLWSLLLFILKLTYILDVISRAHLSKQPLFALNNMTKNDNYDNLDIVKVIKMRKGVDGMDNSFIKRFKMIAQKHSPKCFINCNNEIIIVPKDNIYFKLEDTFSEMDIKCKVIAWLSRPSCKGISLYWQKRVRNIVNEFLGTSFSKDDMTTIYTYLGNDCNRDKSIEFINSGYNLSSLM